MNTRKESKWMSLLVLCTFFVSLAPVVNAQDEVSTKIVGFVKAPMGQGYYYYSVPFKNIGDDEQIIFLNADYNDDGVLDGYSEGTFSNQNFSTGDKIFKFNPATGSFRPAITFRTVNLKTGWFESTPIPPFFAKLTDVGFSAGEGFAVQYANPPAEGGETYMLGEVNDETVEIPINPGFNVIGNPFPSNLLISDAFVVDPSDATISPTPGNGVAPFSPINGDVIMTGFNPATNSWQYRAVFWDNPNTPAADGKWYYATPFPPLFAKEITTDTDLEKWTLQPGKAYLYKAQNGFIWKVDSPVASE